MDSWEEHTHYARIGHKAAAGILSSQLEALAKNVSGSGTRTIVFNPLPWKRDGVGGDRVVRDVPPMGYKTITTTNAPAFFTASSGKGR